MKIQTKLLSSILITVIIAFIATLFFVGQYSNQLLKQKGKMIGSELSQHYGFELRTKLETKLQISMQLATMIEQLVATKQTDRHFVNELVRSTLEKNPDVFGVGIIFEPNAFDGKDTEYINKEGHDKTGRFIPYMARSNGKVILEPLVGYDQPGVGDYYFLPKQSGKPVMMNPYVYKVNGEDVLMTSFMVPIKQNNQVIGAVGVDVSLKTFQEMLESAKPFGTGYLTVGSNNGIYVYIKDPKLIGTKIIDNPKLPEDARKNLVKAIEKGEVTDLTEEGKHVRIIHPIDVGNLGTPWAISATIPMDEINRDISSLIQVVFIVAVVSIILVSFVIYLVVKKVIQNPLSALHQTISNIAATGRFDHQTVRVSGDEIGQLVDNTNGLSTNLKYIMADISETMAEVARGNFNRRVTVQALGDLNTLKDNINFSIDKIAQTMDELTRIMQALTRGDFSARVSHVVEGEFKHTVDHAMMSIENILTNINQTMSEIAEGKLTSRVNVEAPGDFLKLKNHINQTIDMIDSTISEVNKVMGFIAIGNLTHQANANQYQHDFHTLMKNINHSIDSLRHLINNVSESFQIIRNASSEISAGNIDLASRTSNQASNLGEAAASIERFSESIGQNAYKAQQANEHVLKSRTIAQHGGVVIQDVMSVMNEITVSSRKVADIITIIDTIAFQTNILALNAAVESARAGEAGRGFSVVASEVRLLAQRSASAAKDIKSLINETVSKITNGSHFVEKAGSTMNEIVNSVEAITNMMHDISIDSSQQAENINQVKLTVEELDSITQQNAALVEQVAASSESLIMQTKTLHNTISSFVM